MTYIICICICKNRNNKQSHFATMQGDRKDLERAFRVLQAHWEIVRGAATMWKLETLWQLITCCVILHNMIVEDEGEGSALTHDFDKPEDQIHIPKQQDPY